MAASDEGSGVPLGAATERARAAARLRGHAPRPSARAPGVFAAVGAGARDGAGEPPAQRAWAAATPRARGLGQLADRAAAPLPPRAPPRRARPPGDRARRAPRHRGALGRGAGRPNGPRRHAVDPRLRRRRLRAARRPRRSGPRTRCSATSNPRTQPPPARPCSPTATPGATASSPNPYSDIRRAHHRPPRPSRRAHPHPPTRLRHRPRRTPRRRPRPGRAGLPRRQSCRRARLIAHSGGIRGVRPPRARCQPRPPRGRARRRDQTSD